MEPYNPLEKKNLGKSVVDFLLKQKAVPLGGVGRFTGAGVYAIYYNGNFDAYTDLARWNQNSDEMNLPIYIGKAVPSGGRKGNIDPNCSASGTALYGRIDEHFKSIEQAINLETADFWCRYLVVDDIWIPLGESLLIQHYRPIWNSLIDGFGNHDPGAGRHRGARPNWDTLHPGRSWAQHCAPSKWSENEIREQVAQYWTNYRHPLNAERQ